MISDEHAGLLVIGMFQLGLDFPPEEPAAQALARSLAKFAHSNEHAALVIEKWTENWSRWPKPADLVEYCQKYDDPKLTERNALSEHGRSKCKRCHGTGYVQVKGPYGLSAAFPCTHQPETESDRRMGVRLNPTMAKRYAADHAEANTREVEFMRRRVAGEVKGFERVTQADMDALLERVGL